MIMKIVFLFILFRGGEGWIGGYIIMLNLCKYLFIILFYFLKGIGKYN